MLKYEKNKQRGVTILRKVYTIEKSEFENNQLYFILNESNVDIQIQPAKQVIADSDDFAFIYLVDAGEEYSYLRFPPAVWSELVQMLIAQQDAILKYGETTVVLEGFFEELQMLVFNIEGNNNYGLQFTEKVEEIFAPILNNNR